MPRDVPAPEPRSARRVRRAVAAISLLLALGTPGTLAADAPEQRLKSVEQAIEEGRQAQSHFTAEATALTAEIARLRSASVSAAQAAQQHEAALTELEAQLARLDRDEAAKAADLRRRGGESVSLLMALERLARNPPEALALSPGTAVDQARAALLLGAALPRIEEKARRLRAELDYLRRLREGIAEKRRSLLAERDALAQEQLALKALTARKSVLLEAASRGAEIGSQHLAQLSAEASDLRDLITRLEAERQRREEEQRRTEAELRARAATPPPRPAAEPPAQDGAVAGPVRAPSAATAAMAKPEGLRPFSQAHGAMLMPATGRITRHYGENDEYGAASKGILIETRPGAQVVAPFDGRIEFAGPFRGYGQILIIEHGDGYHSLLAGLERIEGVVGQWLVAGEPVGVMPSGDRPPSLYLELRRHGQPINPLPWLATREDKVSG